MLKSTFYKYYQFTKTVIYNLKSRNEAINNLKASIRRLEPYLTDTYRKNTLLGNKIHSFKVHKRYCPEQTTGKSDQFRGLS